VTTRAAERCTLIGTEGDDNVEQRMARAKASLEQVN
jgi:hypothetical protein